MINKGRRGGRRYLLLLSALGTIAVLALTASPVSSPTSAALAQAGGGNAEVHGKLVAPAWCECALGDFDPGLTVDAIEVPGLPHDPSAIHHLGTVSLDGDFVVRGLVAGRRYTIFVEYADAFSGSRKLRGGVVEGHRLVVGYGPDSAPSVVAPVSLGQVEMAADPFWQVGVEFWQDRECCARASDGRTLIAPALSYTGRELAFAYQWLRDGEPIAGATSTRYLSRNADVGHYVTVAVTASRRGFAPWTATARSAGPLLKDSSTRVVSGARIHGRGAVGEVLKLTPPKSLPRGGHNRYYWYRDGVLIHGARGKRYRVRRADMGLPISGYVIVRRSGHQDVSSSAPAWRYPSGWAVRPGRLEVRAKPRKAAVGRGDHVSLVVSVQRNRSVPHAGGTLVVAVDGYRRTLALPPRGKIRFRLELPALSAGEHRIHASVKPRSRYLRRSVAPVATVRVR